MAWNMPHVEWIDNTEAIRAKQRPSPEIQAIRKAESKEHKRLSKQCKAGLHGPCTVCGSWDSLTLGHDVAVAFGGTLADGWHVECRRCSRADGGRVRALRKRR